MAYTKTTWNNGSAPGISAEQLNRIETGIDDLHNGAITPDQTQVPVSPGSGTLFQLFNWLANRIKAITGKTNWYDAPDTTLAAAKAHIDAAAPHSGHETPAGAQAKVDAHANLTTAHGSTSSATANSIMQRDANGRAKVAVPAASDDIARKDTVDSAVSTINANMDSIKIRLYMEV